MNFSFVPQVFYDLIARLVPGSILVCSSILVFKGPEKCFTYYHKLLEGGWTPSFFIIGSFLLVAYILAIVLSGFWERLVRLGSVETDEVSSKKQADEALGNNPTEDQTVQKEQKKRMRLFSWLNQPDMRLSQTFDQELLDSIMEEANSTGIKKIRAGRKIFLFAYCYDLMRIKNPAVGSRFVKIRAERSMCAILFLGWTILFIANLWAQEFVFEEIVHLNSIFLIGIAGSFFYRQHLGERLLDSLGKHWLLYKQGHMDAANEEKVVKLKLRTRNKSTKKKRGKPSFIDISL